MAALVDRARNTFLSGGGRHLVLIDLSPNLPPNAARHSSESSPDPGRRGVRDGVYVVVSVSDEGRGVAPDLLPQS